MKHFLLPLIVAVIIPYISWAEPMDCTFRSLLITDTRGDPHINGVVAEYTGQVSPLPLKLGDCPAFVAYDPAKGLRAKNKQSPGLAYGLDTAFNSQAVIFSLYEVKKTKSEGKLICVYSRPNDRTTVECPE